MNSNSNYIPPPSQPNLIFPQQPPPHNPSQQQQMPLQSLPPSQQQHLSNQSLVLPQQQQLQTYPQQPLQQPQQQQPLQQPQQQLQPQQQQPLQQPQQQLQPLHQQPLPQQQTQQPQKVNQLSSLITSLLNHTDLTKLQKKLQDALEKASDKCIFNHSLLKIANDDKNNILMQFKNAYNNYSKRNMEDKIDRVFRDFCPVCVVFKLGLLCQDVSRDLKIFSCTSINNYDNNNSSIISPHRYKLGHFIHAFNPYKPDRPLKYIKSHHVSESIAFPSGTLIIPEGKILIQLLSIRQDTIGQGLKIVQIMSNEKEISDMRIYLRFLERNKNLEPGYYKRYLSGDDIKEMNQDASKDTIINNTDKTTMIKNFYNNVKAKGITKPESVDNESAIGIKTDQDDNFEIDNVFQNGEPLQHVKRGESASAQEIKMKIFDLNPAFVTYLQSMANIQAYLEKNDKDNLTNTMLSIDVNDNDDDDESDEGKRKKKDYLSFWKPSVPILNSVFYDLLMLGFYNEYKMKKLVNIPPFNDKCVIVPQNIVFFNRKGDIIMTSETHSRESECSIFNKVLKHSNVPLQQKSVITGFSHNVNDKGNPPLSKFPSDSVATMSDRLLKITDPNDNNNNAAQDEVNDKYRVLYNFHKHQSQLYHNQIKDNLDRLKNYFCSFKNDMDEDVKVEDNEIVYDIATRMFPQNILQSTQNKSMHSLHFSDRAKTKPILEEDPNPNCVYVSNLGFVNLVNICDNSPLVLKNSSVYLENLVKRDVVGYYNKTNDNCNYADDKDESDDATRTLSHVSIEGIPGKRKYDPSNTIDLVTKRSGNYNHNAYINLTNCSDTNTFSDYVNKYSGNENNNCLRKM